MKCTRLSDGDGPRQQGLARARRTVKQHALRRENPQSLENARVFQRQLDDFAHASHFALQPADIFVRDGGSANRRLLAFHDADVGALPDDHGPRGNRAHDLEIDGLGESRHADNTSRDDRDADQDPQASGPARCWLPQPLPTTARSGQPRPGRTRRAPPSPAPANPRCSYCGTCRQSGSCLRDRHRKLQRARRRRCRR